MQRHLPLQGRLYADEWWKIYWDCFGAEAHSQTNELAVVKYLLCERTIIESSVTLAAGVKPLPYS